MSVNIRYPLYKCNCNKGSMLHDILAMSCSLHADTPAANLISSALVPLVLPSSLCGQDNTNTGIAICGSVGPVSPWMRAMTAWLMIWDDVLDRGTRLYRFYFFLRMFRHYTIRYLCIPVRE